MLLNNGLDQNLIDERHSLRAMKKALRMSDVSSESSGQESSLVSEVRNKNRIGGLDLNKAEAFMRFTSCVVCTNLLTFDSGISQCRSCKNHIMCRDCANNCDNKCPFCDLQKANVFIPPSNQILSLIKGLMIKCDLGCEKILQGYNFAIQRHRMLECPMKNVEESEEPTKCRLCDRDFVDFKTRQ